MLRATPGDGGDYGKVWWKRWWSAGNPSQSSNQYNHSPTTTTLNLIRLCYLESQSNGISVLSSDDRTLWLSFILPRWWGSKKSNSFAASNLSSQNLKILGECFSLPRNTQQVTSQFLSRHQKASEDPIDYLHSLQLTTVQAFPHLDFSRREELMRSRFVEGLLLGALRKHLLQMPSTSMQNLKIMALLLRPRTNYPVLQVNPTRW